MKSNAILVLPDQLATPVEGLSGIPSAGRSSASHKDSTVDMVHRARAGQVLTLTESELPTAAQVAAGLKSLLEGNTYDAAAVDWEAFESYTARESTRLFVEALDRAYARSRGAAAN